MHRYDKKNDQDRNAKQAIPATSTGGRDFVARSRLEIGHRSTSLPYRLVLHSVAIEQHLPSRGDIREEVL
jgi:hypothetical protein